MVPKLIEANEKRSQRQVEQGPGMCYLQEEKAAKNAEAHCDLCIQLGDEAFASLSCAEQREIDFLVWAGCCMHKEMNSVERWERSHNCMVVGSGFTGADETHEQG